MTPVTVITVLGSWWLTALLLLSLEAAYLVFSFGRNPYPAWVHFLFHTPGGVAIYLLLIVNLTAASVRIVLSRFLRPPLSPEYIRSLDVHTTVPVRDIEAIRAAAEVAGMPVTPFADTEQGIRSVTGTWSFLPGALFRAAIVMILIGLLFTAHSRQTQDVSMRVGKTEEMLGAAVTLTAITADLPADHLHVGDNGTFLLTGVSAHVTVDGRTAVVSPGFPTGINGRWYRIRHLGYSQPLSVLVRGSRNDILADLDLLPPGRSTVVSLPKSSIFLTFSLDPDRTITKGLVTGRQYNLAEPSYHVTAQEGKPRKGPAGSRVRPGERAEVGPVQISLDKQGLLVRLQAVSDPGIFPLYAGVIILLMSLCALFSRFFWYEREIAFLAVDGMLLVGSRDELFKKRGGERFQRWSRSLKELQ